MGYTVGMLRRLPLALLALSALASERPRIGLVLGGGGAHGFAHAGVIRWLQEHRIPIDAVAGTSMGGLIGGLFSAGYDSAEIHSFIREIDWPEALRPGPPFADLTFRRKEDRRLFPNGFELGLKGGVRFPPGLSPAHGVGLILSRFSAPYGDIGAFDELPTPFRCIATDLVSEKQVVFKDGPLFEALRATMSIPGVFTPIRSGDRILVDGGMLNNLPVDVAKQMGVDVVIAVSLPNPPMDPKTGESIIGVLKRTGSVMVSNNERHNMELADILVMPDVTGFDSSNFEQFEGLSERGYNAASAKSRFLALFTVSEPEWAEYLAARRALKRPEKLNKEERIALENRLALVIGEGRHASADYRFVEPEGIEVTPRPKHHGPPFLNTALLLDGASGEGLRFALGGRLTILGFAVKRGEWRTDFTIGEPNHFSSELYLPIKGSRFFFAPSGHFDNLNLDVYSGNRRAFQAEHKDGGAIVDIGFSESRTQEFRAGYRISSISNKIAIGPPLLPNSRGTQKAWRLRWAYDGQDSAIVPRRGFRDVTEAQWVTRDPNNRTNYLVVETNGSWAVPLGRNYSLLGAFSGGSTGNAAAVVEPLRSEAFSA